MRLLVTRPEPDGARTAAALRARGHDVLAAALIRVEPIADAALGAGPWAGVIVTSANAPRALTAHPRRAELLARPVFAVGRRSADAARAAGFGDVTSADGDARDLVRLIAARRAGERAPLIHLAGAERAVDMAAALAPHGLTVQTAVLYRTIAEATLPGPVATALAAGAIDGVLHFSRRSAEAYLAGAARSKDVGAPDTGAALVPTHYCLSEQVAEPLAAAGATDLRVASRPDEAALLDLVPPTLSP